MGFQGLLAGELQLPLLLVHHLRKRDQRASPARPIRADDLLGWSHIVAHASSVLALSIVPQRPTAGGYWPPADA